MVRRSSQNRLYGGSPKGFCRFLAAPVQGTPAACQIFSSAFFLALNKIRLGKAPIRLKGKCADIAVASASGRRFSFLIS